MARRFNMGVCILIFNSWAVLTSVPLGVEPSSDGFFAFTLLTFLQQIPYLGEQTLAVAALLECAPHGLEPLLLMFTLDCLAAGSIGPAKKLAPWAYSYDLATAQLIRNLLLLIIALIIFPNRSSVHRSVNGTSFDIAPSSSSPSPSSSSQEVPFTDL